KESKPRLLPTALGAMFSGFFLGLLATYLRRRLAFAFQSEEEVRQTFPTVPLFGTVPHRVPRKNGEDKPSTHTIFDEDLRSGFAEAYRVLRTNLYYSGAADTDKVIILSSPGPGDGKTLTTLSLAHTLAVDGKR